ncbi:MULTISPECIES: hypothetical protein [unclassified Rathayibacter]|uniref:hypothetical protein n=1 Tax=unclassified Rathayibacter TaxID=2609250 RepID=UPI0006FD67C2|nr:MULTISPECIES: hypothetical protein [unclassified Rathayibacter]KQQ05471.1 hypothetical protein ASF42_02510 [Rathayibacter sp. Leaf294]KQS13334.1 hypothetical protein ASG06_02520 [Rathayibacter sp. Leaf185]
MPTTPLRGDSGAHSRAPDVSAVPSGTPSTDRRSIVRAALWSAPVIAIAFATPAAAASAAPTSPATRATSTIVFDTWQNNAHWDGSGHRTGLDTRIQVQNRYWTGSDFAAVSAPVTTLSVRVRYPASARVGARPVALAGDGWSWTAATADLKGAVEYVFTWSGGALAASRSTPELTYTLNADVPGQVQLSASASAPNADPVAAPSWGDTAY